MKLHFKRYNGDPASLPYKEHMPGATPFREFDSDKEMQKFILTRGLILIILLCTYVIFHSENSSTGMELGLFCSLPALFLRELIRALCFKEDVCYYNVINAIKQMPKGAKTYYYQMHSYWFLPSYRE